MESKSAPTSVGVDEKGVGQRQHATGTGTTACGRCGAEVEEQHLFLHQVRCAHTFSLEAAAQNIATFRDKLQHDRRGISHISSAHKFADLLDPLTRRKPAKDFGALLDPLTKLPPEELSQKDKRFRLLLDPLTKKKRSGRHHTHHSSRSATTSPLSPASPMQPSSPTAGGAVFTRGSKRYADFSQLLHALDCDMQRSRPPRLSPAWGHAAAPPGSPPPPALHSAQDHPNSPTRATSSGNADDAWHVVSDPVAISAQTSEPSLAPSSAAATSSSEEVAALRKRVSSLEHELERVSAQKDLLRGILHIVSSDLHLKNEQFDSLYSNLRLNAVWRELEAQRMHEAREREQDLQDQQQQQQQHGLTPSSVAAPSRGSSASGVEVLELPVECAESVGSSSDAPVCCMDFMPFELRLYLCVFLDYTGIIALGCVSKDWAAVVHDEQLWEHSYRRQWRFHVNHKALQWAVSSQPKTWRQQFTERMKLERAWVRGKPSVMTMSGHTGTVTCLGFQGSQLVSGDDNGTMQLWDVSMDADARSTQRRSQQHSGTTGHGRDDMPLALMQQHHKNTKYANKVTSFVGHCGPVWCLDFSINGKSRSSRLRRTRSDDASSSAGSSTAHNGPDVLVSGSYDRTVKLWNLRSGRNLHTFRGHSSWVSCLQLEGNTIASGSWDASLKLWRYEWDDDIGAVANAGCIQTLAGTPGNAIYCLQWSADKSRIATGCRMEAVQLWDLQAGRITQNLMGHTKQVYCLQFDESKLVSGSGDNTIKVWDSKSSRCQMTLTGHTNTVMALQYDDQFKIVSGGYDKSIRVWDMRMGKCLRTLFAHSSAVFCLQFDDVKIVSGSADKNLKLWDFSQFCL